MRVVSSLVVTAVIVGIGAPEALGWSTSIVVEGVGQYTAFPGCFGGDLSNPVPDVDGFRNGMTQSGSVFSKGTRWTDGAVWASDFYDPEQTNTNDWDYWNFDQPNTAFSYYTGHGGDASPGDSQQFCFSASSCNNPGPGATYPAICRRAPGDYWGYCNYTQWARSLVIANCTAGGGNHGGVVNYSSGDVKWGESPGHSWAGAGSNGGANVVVLHASNAEMSDRNWEIWPAFAGMHMLATTMVHTGDTAITSDRGANFAARYQANPNGSVAQAWADAQNANADRNDWCKNGFGTVSYGGGFGFNGCGGQSATAMGVSSQEVYDLLGESWYEVRYDNDASGNGWRGTIFNCNFDCWTWTMSI